MALWNYASCAVHAFNGFPFGVPGTKREPNDIRTKQNLFISCIYAFTLDQWHLLPKTPRAAFLIIFLIWYSRGRSPLGFQELDRPE